MKATQREAILILMKTWRKKEQDALAKYLNVPYCRAF